VSTITLVYDVNVGVQSPAAMVALVAAIALPRGELDLIGASITGDVTAVNGALVRRTVTLTTNAQGNANFPTDAEKIAATRDLYRGQLEIGFPGQVTAAVPVVAP
jgi:hypothetical protein